MVAIYKGDALDAFGSVFLTINLKNPEELEITKAKLKIGNLPAITINEPEFPLQISLSSAQTRQLQAQNECFLAVYDNLGRKITCKGSLKFVAKDEVVF